MARCIWITRTSSQVAIALSLLLLLHLSTRTEAIQAIPNDKRASIRGAVSTSGRELPGAAVMVLRRQHASGRTLHVIVGRTTTDHAGAFVFEGLSPGRYFLAARTEGAVTGSSGDGSASFGYYPGSLQWTDAAPIDLLAGESLREISWSLLPLARRMIAGTVVRRDGLVPANIPVRARALEGIIGLHDGSARTGEEGHFEIRGLIPGEYALDAEVPDPGGTGTGLLGFSAASLQGADAAAVQIEISGPIQLKGQIVLDGRPPDQYMGMVRILAVPVNPAYSSRVSVTNAKPDGSFDLRMAPAAAVIGVVGLPAGWALKSVRANRMDITDIGVRPETVRDPEPIQVELTRYPSLLRGTVKAAPNVPAKACSVVVFAQDPNRWSFASRYVRLASCDSNGRFSAVGLPPGNYSAIATNDKQSGDLLDPEYLGWAAPRGKAFRIRNSETTTLDLSLVSGRDR